jgi:hypothetical protein
MAGALAIVAAASLGGTAAGRQAALPAAQEVPQQQPPQSTFRTGVTIVPVDVRVLDREGRHVADLDLVVYVADDKERIIKESRHKVDLKLKDENYQRYLREGIPFDVTMRAAQPPKYVKVIVYDYAADLLGSSIVKLK